MFKLRESVALLFACVLVTVVAAAGDIPAGKSQPPVRSNGEISTGGEILTGKDRPAQPPQRRTDAIQDLLRLFGVIVGD